MHKIEYRTKKKGKLNIVWLQKSNKYISLKNPAFDIFRLLSENSSKENIYNFLKDKYGFSNEICGSLVADFKMEIEKINISDDKEKETPILLKCSGYCFNPHSVISYKFGEKAFLISYEEKYLENWLHPIFSHLKTEKTEDAAFHFEIFKCEGNIVFRDKSLDNNTIHAADKIFQHLSNKLFEKSENDWLLKAHASAVTNHKKTILFSGASGSGKTTLAALLLQKGFDLVSDDLVLIDKQLRAYGFPSAMSIKKGSVKKLLPAFPELANKPEIQVSPEKQVRYLNSNSGRKEISDLYPVKEVVFVKYNPKSDFKLTKLTCSKGIQAFLEQAFISPDPECAETFLDWAVNASFYKLTYSDSEITMNALIKLFENDL